MNKSTLTKAELMKELNRKEKEIKSLKKAVRQHRDSLQELRTLNDDLAQKFDELNICKNHAEASWRKMKEEKDEQVAMIRKLTDNDVSLRDENAHLKEEIEKDKKLISKWIDAYHEQTTARYEAEDDVIYMVRCIRNGELIKKEKENGKPY